MVNVRQLTPHIIYQVIGLPTRWRSYRDHRFYDVNFHPVCISVSVSVEFLAGLSTKVSAFPGSEDLAGAAEALLRLQDTYALDTHQIAAGDLMGVHDSPRMSGISISICLFHLFCSEEENSRHLMHRTIKREQQVCTWSETGVGLTTGQTRPISLIYYVDFRPISLWISDVKLLLNCTQVLQCCRRLGPDLRQQNKKNPNGGHS